MTETAGSISEASGIGNRVLPPRFIVFLAVGVASWFACRAMLSSQDWRDGTVLAFDAAAVVFLVSLVPLLRDCSAADMRVHARQNDANRHLMLGITILLTLVAMAALTGELDGARKGQWPEIAKLVATLLLIWAFANSVYALHYAHAYYLPGASEGKDAEGIEFPGTANPGYWDFAYFAFTVGMTFQTSDVAVTSTGIRRVVLTHSFAAFVFNIGVIAFTINVLGGASR